MLVVLIIIQKKELEDAGSVFYFINKWQVFSLKVMIFTFDITCYETAFHYELVFLHGTNITPFYEEKASFWEKIVLSSFQFTYFMIVLLFGNKTLKIMSKFAFTSFISRSFTNFTSILNEIWFLFPFCSWLYKVWGYHNNHYLNQKFMVRPLSAKVCFIPVRTWKINYCGFFVTWVHFIKIGVEILEI